MDSTQLRKERIWDKTLALKQEAKGGMLTESWRREHFSALPGSFYPWRKRHQHYHQGVFRVTSPSLWNMSKKSCRMIPLGVQTLSMLSGMTTSLHPEFVNHGLCHMHDLWFWFCQLQTVSCGITLRSFCSNTLHPHLPHSILRCIICFLTAFSIGLYIFILTSLEDCPVCMLNQASTHSLWSYVVSFLPFSSFFQFPMTSVLKVSDIFRPSCKIWIANPCVLYWHLG